VPSKKTIDAVVLDGQKRGKVRHELTTWTSPAIREDLRCIKSRKDVDPSSL